MLLAGAALNLWGSARLTALAVVADAQARAVLRAVPGAQFALPGQLVLFQCFTAGTAAVFGSLYLYLWFYPAQVLPFLVFGAVLKTWAAVLAGALYHRGRIDARLALEFGLGNGVVAALFWALLAQA